MTRGQVRVRRLVDLILLSLASAGLFLSLFFLAGQIWFTQLFNMALKGKTPLAVALCGVVALLAGCSYVFLPPPCPPAGNGGIRGSKSGNAPSGPPRGRDEEGQS